MVAQHKETILPVFVTAGSASQLLQQTSLQNRGRFDDLLHSVRSVHTEVNKHECCRSITKRRRDKRGWTHDSTGPESWEDHGVDFDQTGDTTNMHTKRKVVHSQDSGGGESGEAHTVFTFPVYERVARECVACDSSVHPWG